MVLIWDETFENFDAFTAIKVVVVVEQPRKLDQRAVRSTFVHNLMLWRVVPVCGSAAHCVELGIRRDASEVRKSVRERKECGDRSDVPNFVVGESLRSHFIDVCVGDSG